MVENSKESHITINNIILSIHIWLPCGECSWPFVRFQSHRTIINSCLWCSTMHDHINWRIRSIYCEYYNADKMYRREFNYANQMYEQLTIANVVAPLRGVLVRVTLWIIHETKLKKEPDFCNLQIIAYSMIFYEFAEIGAFLLYSNWNFQGCNWTPHCLETSRFNLNLLFCVCVCFPFK